jgi:hypothetical protein
MRFLEISRKLVHAGSASPGSMSSDISAIVPSSGAGIEIRKHIHPWPGKELASWGRQPGPSFIPGRRFFSAECRAARVGPAVPGSGFGPSDGLWRQQPGGWLKRRRGRRCIWVCRADCHGTIEFRTQYQYRPDNVRSAQRLAKI